MTVSRFSKAALCVVFAVSAIAPGIGRAQGPRAATEQESYESLLMRLERAESKIGVLERELFEAHTSTTIPHDSHAGRSVDSAFLPDGEFEEAGFTALSPASVDPGDGISVEEIVSEFRKRWEEQEQINDDFSGKLKLKASSGTSLSTMRIVGRVHADYWAFPESSPGINVLETDNVFLDPQDRFGFRRLRFGVRGDIWENMEYRIEMEFAGGDESEFRDAWLGFNHLPVLQKLLIGNQKRPYGLDHINSSRYNVFLERPFVVEAFNQDSRRLGIQSWGYSDDLRYNWRYGLFNLRLIQDEGIYLGDHYQAELAGRFANTIWYDEFSDGRGYAHWAVSGSIAHPNGSALEDNGDIGPDADEARFRTRPEARSSSRWLDTGIIARADWYELLGLEAVVNVGPVQVVGEYMNIWLERDPPSDGRLHFSGGYAYVSYFLTGEHMAWDRESGELDRVIPFENFFLVDTCSGECGRGWGAWQVALRYSYGDLTDRDILGGVGESVTFGLNWLWNPNARMQFNYIWGRISERNVTDENGFVATGGDYQILGARFMVDF